MSSFGLALQRRDFLISIGVHFAFVFLMACGQYWGGDPAAKKSQTTIYFVTPMVASKVIASRIKNAAVKAVSDSGIGNPVDKSAVTRNALGSLLKKATLGKDLKAKVSALSAHSNPDALMPKGAVRWDQIDQIEDMKKIPQADRDQLAKLMSKQQDAFRGCYERALLHEPSLRGHATLVLSVGASGGISDTAVEFRGDSLGNGLSVLKKCFSETAGRIRVPGNLAGQKVKFGLLLKS